MKRVLVVGGGVTGLAAAWALARAARELSLPLQVKLVEREGRLGGKVLTERVGGFVLDAGPDSLFYLRPWARALVDRLGLGGELLEQDPRHRTVFVLRGGKLHPVPASLLSLAPSRLSDLLRAPLSARAKLRAALEVVIPPARDAVDESIASFVRRRFGPGFLEELAEPLMAGIHGGLAEELSMAALYPQMLDMERKGGSVVRAMAAHLAARSGAASAFRSFRGGMARLVEAMATGIGEGVVELQREVGALRPERGRWEVGLLGGPVEADALLLAVPAWAAARLATSFRPSLARVLAEQRYAPAASLLYGFRREDVGFPLEGSGYLAPRTEGTFLGGCSWLSEKWPGRAPEGRVLLRAYAGRAGQDGLLRLSPEELLAAGLEELRRVLDLRGEPVLARAYLWPHAMPQYRVGHLDWLAEVEKEVREVPGLFLAGASYRGVGVPDCFGQGVEAARCVLHFLFPGSAEALHGFWEP